MTQLTSPPHICARVLPRGMIAHSNVFTVLLKATYEICESQWIPAEAPCPLFESDVTYEGYQVASDPIFSKRGVDLIVLGDAIANGSTPVTSMDVAVEFGPLRLTLTVTGDRRWTKGFFGWRATDPERFMRMPIRWQGAFGGPLDASQNRKVGLPDNPEGKGYLVNGVDEQTIEGSPLPNLEWPDARIASPGEAVEPAGLGFYPMTWGLRLKRGIEVEPETGRPQLLPRLFNQAHPRLEMETIPTHGGFEVRGMTPHSPWRTLAPPPSPTLHLARSDGRTTTTSSAWDTICAIPELDRVILSSRLHIWTGSHLLSTCQLAS